MGPFTKRFALACLIVVSWGAVSSAQAISAIEEDWELDLNTPNSAKSSPQLVCVTSPSADCEGYYATFEINKQSAGGGAGGMQVQLWHGSDQLAVGSFPSTYSLDSDGERIRWTTSLSISNKGVLTFQVINGTSQTWGKFGSTGQLTASASSNLVDLNSYDPNVSAANSGVDFGNARVNKLILRRVRTYTNGKKNVERALDRVVYPQ